MAQENVGETDIRAYPKEGMLAGIMKVGIDEQRPFAELRKANGEIGGYRAASGHSAWAHDDQGLMTLLEPAQHELAA